ncbi:MAG: glycosyltransferase [Phycisphaeraceae bacterium]|nr:glycosyltransferase [Phycisphaeraceae bacterium]
MRIVLVNWAAIWDGASKGGGVNGYCQALALALAARGHEVVSLFGGTTHLRTPRECAIRRHDDWLGVRVFEVINSPVLAPSIQQFQDPAGEVSAPELEAQVGRLFDWIRPDVVHWHNIEGFSIGCVDRARACGARVVFSLHNYHTICPQVYLMQRHREVCTSFDNGHACAGCIQTSPTAVERQRRIEEGERLASRISGRKSPRESALAAAAELRSSLSWIKRATGATARLAASLGRAAIDRSAIEIPGRPVRSPDEALSPLPLHTDTRGQTARLVAEQAAPTPAPPDDPQRRPLLNVIEPEPPSSKPANAYGHRRAAMVRMLNSCDRVLAVSDFVRRKFISMGVEQGRIAAQPIGTRINHLVRRARPLVFDPPRFETVPPTPFRPVRIVFMGYNHYYKGLGMFAEALETLAPEHMRRIDLSIYALDGQSIEWMFRRMEPRLARLTFTPGYDYTDIPWMLGGKDLGVVCSVWWDNAPQTVFEFQACGLPVLGAAVGGIPDFVHDGVNGLLFRGNDRADLARRLVEVLDNPFMLERLRAAVTPPKDIDDHALELESIYAAADPRP